MLNRESIRRCKAIESELVGVIEEHLPGNFSSWEVENSTWDGKEKTVHNAGRDPRARTCAWRIFVAADESDDMLGFTDRQANSQALNQLGKGLKQAVEAIEILSLPIQTELDRAASKRFRKSFEQPSKQIGSTRSTLLLIEQAMRSGIEAAFSRLNEIGDEENRKNRKAAAVVEACRHVYLVRSKRPAPETTRDYPQKKDPMAPPALFVEFAQDVFKVLGIKGSVSHALTLAKPFRN